MDKTKKMEISLVEKGFSAGLSEDNGNRSGVTAESVSTNNIADGSESEHKIRENNQNASVKAEMSGRMDNKPTVSDSEKNISDIHRYERDLYTQSKVESWMREANQIAEKYPDFDLRGAVKDKRFLGMLRAGLGIAESYRALNYDGIFKMELEKAMSALYDDIRARGMRPYENGMMGSGGINIGLGARSFSKRERAEIAKRVENGEKIVL